MTNLLGKRGQVNDFVGGVVLLFVFGLISIFVYLILSQFNAQFALAGLNTAYMDVVSDRFLVGVRVLDWLAVFLCLAVVLAVGVSSFKVASHPVYFVVTFILAPFLGFMAYVLSYVYQMVVSNAVFASTILYFPRTIIIVTNLHWVMLACVVVGSLAMFAKKGQGQFINE